MASVFLSYQTQDKAIAGRIKEVLAMADIDAFLAHEDITISEEWRIKILEEIGQARIFICILSKNYMASSWCIQESGIAAFRRLPTIPYSLDGTIPPGFLGHIQSGRLDSRRIFFSDLMPGIVKADFEFGIDIAIKALANSGSFRGAEVDFEVLLPYIPRMNDAQVKRILEACAENDQVHHAQKCATVYIPPLLQSHGQLITQEQRDLLNQMMATYRR